MFLAGSARCQRQCKPSRTIGDFGSPLLVGLSSATCFHLVPVAARPAEWSKGPKYDNIVYTLDAGEGASWGACGPKASNSSLYAL